LAQVEEGLLKALLHDVFGVFSNPGAAERDGENPLLVTRDQNFKCLGISAFSGGNQSGLIPFRDSVERRDRWCPFFELFYEWRHSVPPGSCVKSGALAFKLVF